MAENKNTYQHKGTCDVGCEEFVSTDCVVYDKEIPFLLLEEGATVTEVIEKLVQTISHLSSQINQ